MYEPNKSLGQNFLEDPAVAQDMVSALDVANGDDVIEIGPGLGAVTDVLVNSIVNTDFNLYAVEIDPRFSSKLEDAFLHNPDVHIINDDILEFLPKFSSDQPVKIIGSLPYYITSPIIHAVIKMAQQPQQSVFLIQKEVAQKIAATAPDASYISTFVQTFYKVTYLRDVPRTKFRPEPEVDGAVVSLMHRNIALAEFGQNGIERYEGFLHRAFKNPRKMLNKAFSKDELAKANIKPTLRPEAVSVDEWVEAFKVIALK